MAMAPLAYSTVARMLWGGMHLPFPCIPDIVIGKELDLILKTALPLLRYQESCGYGREQFPEQDVGRLSVNYNINEVPDIGGVNTGGDYLIVSRCLWRTRSKCDVLKWHNLSAKHVRTLV